MRTAAPLRALVLLAIFSNAWGAASGHADHALGRVRFPVSCSAAAQQQFNTGVALLHHMTYPQAREAFQGVAETDPKCAMAHWGIAMTFFQPLWPTRPGPKELNQGWAQVQQAIRLGAPGLREQMFVATVEAFFLEPQGEDYWLRIRRWKDALQKLHRRYPADVEASAFYALALLASAPANSMSNENADEAARLLLQIYRDNPEHPGAMHYLVHASDSPGREKQALQIVHKYEDLAPDNPHALHMPTHIYTRLGDWDGVIRGNLRAADAALQYPAGDQAEFVWDEFPHAIEYLIYAYLQKGDDAHAVAQLARLRVTPRLEPTFKTAFHLASTQARIALETRNWPQAAAIVPREPAALAWDKFAWPEAIARFARGLGAAHLGNLKDAREQNSKLQDLQGLMGRAGEDLFARSIGVLRLDLEAWIAHADADDNEALARMREAAELEAATPKAAVTPAPTLPAAELLGDLLMDLNRSEDALAAYRASLVLYPRRFNGLLGAARAARAHADAQASAGFYRELLQVAAGSSRPVLDEARRFADQ